MNKSTTIPELEPLAAELAKVPLQTKLLGEMAVLRLAATLAAEGIPAKHLKRGFAPSLRLFLTLHLGGAYRVLATSQENPGEADCERFLRLADMATLHFWRYRSTSRGPEYCSHLFNYKFAQAEADIAAERAAMDIFESIEAVLLSAGVLSEHKRKPAGKSKLLLAAIEGSEERLNARLDSLEMKLDAITTVINI